MESKNLSTLFPNGYNASASTPDNNILADQLFLQVLQDAGFLTDHIDVSGEIQRCGTKEKPKSKEAWYVYFYGTNFSSGAYGNWRTGESHTWCSVNKDELTPTQLTEHREHVKKQKKLADLARKQEQDHTAKEVQALIAGLTQANRHIYLDKKHVQPYGIYLYEKDNSLIIPMRNIDGEIRSCQTIYEDGSKWFRKGGEKKGCFHLLGSVFTNPTYIVEGYATGATVYKAIRKSVVVAFDSGNLKPVVEAIRSKGNDHWLVICADNDRDIESDD